MSVRVLKRNRAPYIHTYCVYIQREREREIIRSWLTQLWRLTRPVVSKLETEGSQ